MESFLFNSTISLILLYILYRMVLRYETNHQLNRFLGLACMIFSTVVLLIPIDSLFVSNTYSDAVYRVIQSSYDIQDNISPAVLNTSASIYFMVYIVGIGVFSLRSLIGLTSLIYFYFNSKKCHRWGFRVVTVERNISPFTFFNILFIGNRRLEDEHLDVMLVHEQFHRDQFHSIDSLILEVLTIIFWFNSVIWLFQRDIKAEHEYLADGQVLKKGIDRLEYQQLLFQSRTGVSIQSVNYLSNKTSLKKRFKMMTNKKVSTKMSFIRLAAFLPAIGFILLLSSFSELYPRIQPDVTAVYKQGIPAMYHTVADNIKYPQSARNENRSGLVYISFTVNENGDVKDVSAERKKGDLLEQIVVVGNTSSSEGPKGINGDINLEAVRAVKLLGKFTPAEKDGVAVSSLLVLPIQFKLR